MKKIKILAGVLFLIGIIVYGAYQAFFRLAVPGYTGTLVLDGLKSKVEVKTDEYAIPHIFAENRDDLFFAQGYITARERLFQMELTRLAGRGELSTLLGEATLEKDKFLRFPSNPVDARAAMDLFPMEIAASNWMIFSGKMTASGKALFAGSPDLKPTLPALFYMMRINGGGYDVAGGSLPGVPGIGPLGYNGKIAWSAVNGRGDELDYFVEKIRISGAGAGATRCSLNTLWAANWDF